MAIPELDLSLAYLLYTFLATLLTPSRKAAGAALKASTEALGGCSAASKDTCQGQLGQLKPFPASERTKKDKQRPKPTLFSISLQTEKDSE